MASPKYTNSNHLRIFPLCFRFRPAAPDFLFLRFFLPLVTVNELGAHDLILYMREGTRLRLPHRRLCHAPLANQLDAELLLLLLRRFLNHFAFIRDDEVEVPGTTTRAADSIPRSNFQSRSIHLHLPIYHYQSGVDLAMPRSSFPTLFTEQKKKTGV